MGAIQLHRNYKLAAYLILAAVSVGIFKIISVYWNADISLSENYIPLALNSFILVLLLWLGLNISKGKEWARVTFAVLSVCIIVLAPFVVLKEFHASLITGILSSLFGLLLLIALVLLYSRSIREWHASQG